MLRPARRPQAAQIGVEEAGGIDQGLAQHPEDAVAGRQHTPDALGLQARLGDDTGRRGVDDRRHPAGLGI